MGKGCSKKRMFYCNDRNRFLTNSKECWLRTGAGSLYIKKKEKRKKYTSGLNLYIILLLLNEADD